MSAAATKAPKVTVRVREATAADSAELIEVINEAYMADAFFKKKEYALRATPENVANALSGTAPDRFLVACLGDAEKIVGAIRVEWDPARAVGTFGTVTSIVERKGVGSACVAAAEERLREAKCTRIEMHVIDVREDVLRPWYSKQGYTRTDEAKPFVAPEILAEDYKNVMMVLYTKEL